MQPTDGENRRLNKYSVPGITIRDILPGIGIYTDGIDKIGIIKPKFLRWGAEGKYWEEEWVAESKEGAKTFSLALTPTPDGGADYHIKLKQ